MRSPPARGRGSKRVHDSDLQRQQRVAPLAGARIETHAELTDGAAPAGRPLRGGADRNVAERERRVERTRSLPSRGRGSKRPADVRRSTAPSVAPCAGARIETCDRVSAIAARYGRPLRGGADRNIRHARDRRHAELVAPCAGARIETPYSAISASTCGHGSPPARGRGSKPAVPRLAVTLRLSSPPARGRGSKPHVRVPLRSLPLIVAPCAGARIETAGRAGHRPDAPGRPLRGGADRNTLFADRVTLVNRRPLRGGADRNV